MIGLMLLRVATVPQLLRTVLVAATRSSGYE
jgi:hypothetical protein